MWEGPAHSRRCHPWAGGLRSLRKQAEQASTLHSLCRHQLLPSDSCPVNPFLPKLWRFITAILTLTRAASCYFYQVGRLVKGEGALILISDISRVCSEHETLGNAMCSQRKRQYSFGIHRPQRQAQERYISNDITALFLVPSHLSFFLVIKNYKL